MTVEPYVADRRSRRLGGSARARRAPPASSSCARTGSRRSRSSAEAAAAGVDLETFAAALERRSGRAPGRSRGRPHAARRRQAGPADPRRSGARGSAWSSRPASGSIGRSSSAGRPGTPDRALVSRTVVRLGEGAEAALVEELVASGPDVACAAGETVPQSLFSRDPRGRPRTRSASLAVASIQDLPRRRGRLPAPPRHDRRGGHPPLGARPARRTARPLPGRQPARGRPEHRGAGRDRLRLGRPALRPDLVHPPRRSRHDRQPAEQGRPARRGPELPQGPHRHRPDRGGHRQLPGRVRDEPLEAGPRRGDPEPRDRPAGLPPGGPLELGRPDRRDPALLPREPRHRAGRGAQVHRPRLPRAGRRPGPARDRPRPPARAPRGEVGGGRTGRGIPSAA